jgi:PIN domain nuclease of toxin-antitoxin system
MVTSNQIQAVTDASAVLAWVFDERGADVVERVLPASGISAVNFAEVLYIGSTRRYDPDQLEADLAAYGLRLLSFSGDEARSILDVKAAETSAGLRLSLADRCCLATAITHDVPAVVSDTAWEALDLPIEVQPFR